jgi:hypothetical protein
VRHSRSCTGSALTLTIPIAPPFLEKSRRRQRTARSEGDRQGRDSGQQEGGAQHALRQRREIDGTRRARALCQSISLAFLVRSESAYRRRPFLLRRPCLSRLAGILSPKRPLMYAPSSATSGASSGCASSKGVANLPTRRGKPDASRGWTVRATRKVAGQAIRQLSPCSALAMSKGDHSPLAWRDPRSPICLLTTKAR